MADIFETVIIFTLAVIIILITVFASRRIRLYLSLRSLRKIDGVTVNFCSHLGFLRPRSACCPCAEITAGEKTFDVYLFSGESRFRYVHIASDKYAATYSKLGGMTPRGGGREFIPISRLVVAIPVGISRPKTRFLPTVKADNGHIPVLLFSPVPNELTYVTPEKTSIRIAFTGDRVGNFTVFTRKSFCNHIDRVSRGFDIYTRRRDEE